MNTNNSAVEKDHTPSRHPLKKSGFRDSFFLLKPSGNDQAEEFGVVLLVDDDENSLEMLSSCLTNGGFRVVTAKNGEEALRHLDKFEPQLIISDVMMPEMSGYELCRKVRALGLDEIPFLFVSALASLPERIIGLRMGADDYIVKPINPEELLLKVSIQVGRTQKLQALKKAAESKGSVALMTGNLQEVSPADLFQLLDYWGHGDLCVYMDDLLFVGKVYLSGKHIVHAEIGNISGSKAFYRLLTWSAGTFRVQVETYNGRPTISGRLQQALVQGLAHMDECRFLRVAIAEQGEYFVVQHSPDLFKRRFEEKTSMLLALIESHHYLGKILDYSPLTDLETLRILYTLMHTGIISSAAASPEISNRGENS